MTKEELEKKRNELADQVEIPHFAKSYSERAGHIASYKTGFDSAVSLLLPRLEEAEKLLSNLVNSKVVKNAELIGYSEAYLLARQYLENKNDQRRT